MAVTHRPTDYAFSNSPAFFFLLGTGRKRKKMEERKIQIEDKKTKKKNKEMYFPLSQYVKKKQKNTSDNILYEYSLTDLC
ncbi:hypothetical protein FKM82_008175 [Ascaphus truei]